jgi:hypothetical protein
MQKRQYASTSLIFIHLEKFSMNIEHIILTKRVLLFLELLLFGEKITSQTWRQKINS